MSLTLKSYLIAAMLALTCIVDTWSGSRLTVVWMLGGMILTAYFAFECLLTLRRDRASLTAGFDCIAPTRIELGQTTPVELRFNNQLSGARRLRLQIRWNDALDAGDDVLTLNAEGDNAASATVNVAGNRLGDSAIGVAHVQALGPFGLAWWQLTVPIDRKITVVPTRLKNDAALAYGASGAGRKTSAGHSGTEIREIRDYQQGDPLRSIDWKATARTGDYKVRSFEPEQRLDIVMLVDTGRSGRLQIDALDRIGHCTNLAARFCELAERRGDNVALLSYDERVHHMIPLGRGKRHLALMRSTIGALRSAGAESDPRTAVARLAQLAKRRSLVIILTQIDEFQAASELIGVVRQTVRKHFVVVVNIRSDHGIKDPHADDSQASGSPWLKPWCELAELEYQRAVDRTRLELERYGVAVVDAGADSVEKELVARYLRIKERRAVG